MEDCVNFQGKLSQGLLFLLQNVSISQGKAYEAQLAFSAVRLLLPPLLATTRTKAEGRVEVQGFSARKQV